MPDDLFDRPETAILIDTEKRELRRVEWSTPDELDKLCGGPRQEGFALGKGLMLNLCRVNLVDGGVGFRVSGRPFEGIGVITGGLGSHFTEADIESMSHHISFFVVGKSEPAGRGGCAPPDPHNTQDPRMPNTAITDANWHDQTTLLDIPEIEPHTPELVAARGRYEAAAVEYQAWLRMARSAEYGTQGARMAADDLLSESMDAPDDAALQARSESAEAELASQQARQPRLEAIVNARGRAARKELDEAAAALRNLLAADLH